MKYDSLKLENQICFPLYVCSKEIIKKYKPFLDALGITYTQYITLMALWEEDNVTVKDIGDKLYLDSGTLTPLLKKMESQGLIVRQRSATDERNVYVKLTQEGIQLKEKALVVPSQIVSCVNLSKEEAMTLHELLHKLLNKIV
jgi:DNA-binding MarR family transcriptional regulator